MIIVTQVSKLILKIKDDYTKRVKNAVSVFREVNDLSDLDIVKVARNDQLDIAIDLNGLTKYNRVSIFSYRVAPIQISWLAYINTTGLDTIDYLLVDNNLVKSHEKNLYSEKILKLPDIWNAHSGFTYERKYNELPFDINESKTYNII